MNRPPKHWMRRCVQGVEKSGGAADPGAVCGSLWYHKTSAAQKRHIMKEEKMLDNPIKVTPFGVVAIGLGALGAWWLWKKSKETTPSTTAGIPVGDPTSMFVP